MARAVYPPAHQLTKDWTSPPKIQDMKFYQEYEDTEDDRFWPPDKILYGFVFYEDDYEDRSLPDLFLLEMENLDTGEVQSSTQIYNESVYRLWQRQDEHKDDSVDTSGLIVNSRVTVTPVNDFGEGETSSFILPFKDLIWTRSKDNHGEETFGVLSQNWKLFSEEPNERENRSKVMYIYLDVPESDIELDRVLLGTEEWSFDSITDYKTVNERAYRWSVSDAGYRKLDRNGWANSTPEEQTFIVDIIQSMLPTYRDYLNQYSIAMDEPHVFKMAIENPTDNRDTIIIYLMKEKQWEV